jgi:hypothetical protein
MSNNLSSFSEKTETNSSTNESLAKNTKENNSLAAKLMKVYQADQQVKYLHLEAEIDLLLQELQTLKQQKLLAKNLKTEDLKSLSASLVPV